MNFDELQHLSQLLSKFHTMQDGPQGSYSAQSYRNTRLDVMEQVDGALEAKRDEMVAQLTAEGQELGLYSEGP